MSEARQAITGILAALVSAVIIFGSIILALTETGQRVARLPETLPTLDTPMPPVDTPAPGEPTFTASPTHIPQTPALEATFSCAMRPGWQPLTVLAGDTWESLALEHSTDLSTFLAGNCQDEEKYKNNRLQSGMVIYVPKSQASPTLSPTASPTSSATATIQAEPASGKPKTGQNKPKPTPCGPPASWVRYTVRSGDNLTRIALATGTTVARLRNANCLNTTLIRTGQRLWVPRLPVIIPVRTATPRPTRTATLTRTSPPTTRPPDTVVPPTERPTDPPPSNTPVVPTPTSPPTAYP
jgi:LysM repeat protein